MSTLSSAIPPSRVPHNCPSCGQRVQLVRRSISSGMVAALAALLEAERRDIEEWHHWRTVVKRARTRMPPAAEGGDPCKLEYWGLVERLRGTRPDGSDRVGYWRTTALGRQFLRGRRSVKRYALTYNRSFFGFEGEYVTVRECVKRGFDYDELIRWVDAE